MHEDNFPSLRVLLMQPPLRVDNVHPLEATRQVIALMEQELVRSARESSHLVSLVVLPELCPVGYTKDTFERYMPNTPSNRAMYQDMQSLFLEAAKRHRVYLCFGTIGFEGEEYFIRQVVLDPQGETIAIYDKIHVCDYGDCSETRYFVPGKRGPVSFSIPMPDGSAWIIGIIICADMRYPQLARALLCEHGCHALIQPACFARDCSFYTWRAFLETRAVESGMYIGACNYSGDYYGNSRSVPPWVDEDHQTSQIETEEGSLVTIWSKEELERARSEFPFYRHAMDSSSSSGHCPSCSTRTETK